jgi:cytochrome P450
LVVLRDDAIGVLAGAGFGVTPHIEFTAALADRLKIDLSATLTVMRLLPLWIDGPQHAKLRRKVAAFLAEDRSNKLARAKTRIRRAVIKALGRDGSEHVDLLRMVCEVVDLFMEELTGIPQPDGDPSNRPSIFSSNLGVGARKRLEALLKHQFAQAKDLFPNEPIERHAMRVGQWTMGRDPLIGTLCLSLHHHLDRLEGGRLKARRLPSVPTHTGVPAIGRIAKVAQTVAGCPVAAGELVECRLDSLTGRPAAERQRFFGAGSHLCLGKPLALALWDCVADLLAELDIQLTTTDFALAHNDVFDIPAVFAARKSTPSRPLSG